MASMSAVAYAGVVPRQSSDTSGVSSRGIHRIPRVAGIGAWSRSDSTFGLCRRGGPNDARASRKGTVRSGAFAKAALVTAGGCIAPGGYSRSSQVDTQDTRVCSTGASGPGYRAFAHRRNERVTRRVVHRASPKDDTPDPADRGRYLKRGFDQRALPGDPLKQNPISKLFQIGDDSSPTARDAIAAVSVAYAFAAWRSLQWPAATPLVSAVPSPLLAFAVALGATVCVAPLLALAAHPSANYGVRYPLLTRAAFGVEGARALTSARRLVCSALCAAHFLAGANAMHVLAATVVPAASVLGGGAWSSAGCYLLAWLAQSPAGGVFCRAVLMKAGGAFAVVAALSAAKIAAFTPTIVASANAMGGSVAAASHGTSSAFALSSSVDVGLGLVGVWFAMSSSFLDTTASATVKEATEATRLGRALPPASDRAWRYAKRLPIASALAAVVVSSALNPAGAFGTEIGSQLSSWLFPALVALAAPAATAVIRGGGGGTRGSGNGSTTVADANVALFAAAATLFAAGVPSKSVDALLAATGGGAFAVATAVVAPTMAVALADYFIVRKRVIDTTALVDGRGKTSDFWFKNGVNPRAAVAALLGAAVPLMDFCATAEIGFRMVGVVGPGVESIIAPGVALARGAGVGGVIAAAAYLALNALAPPPRVSSSGGASARGRGGAARVITEDGTATGVSVDDAMAGEAQAEADSLTVDRTPGSGSESKGERWGAPPPAPPGGPGDDDDTNTRVDRARSRLERLLEMESATPPPPPREPPSQNTERPYDSSALGLSLKQELQSHLERRRSKLGELRAERSAKGIFAVSEETIARVAADVDALVFEISTFENCGVSYTRNAGGNVVANAANEIARVKFASADETSAAGGYLADSGVWKQVAKCAAEVTKLDLEMEKLAARALVTGKPYAQSEMSELRERRGAWGLRLVAAQIKGVDNVKREVARLENGRPSSSSSVNGTASQTSDAVSEREVKRLEVLAQEKQALLTRLTEKEKEGAVASEGAKALRGEVVQLRTQLNDAQQKLQRNSKLNADATYAFEQALATAEKQKFALKMNAETEASKLFSQIVALQKTLALRETELGVTKAALQKSEAVNADLSAANVVLTETTAELQEKVTRNETEISTLKTSLKTLRAEMAEKDLAYAAATKVLKQQLVDTKQQLANSEGRLVRAKQTSVTLEKQRDQSRLDAAAAAVDAEKRRVVTEVEAEQARVEASALENTLRLVEQKLVDSENATLAASEAAAQAVLNAKEAEKKREEETRVAVRNMRGAEKALLEKEEALRMALFEREANVTTSAESLKMETEFAAERAARAELDLEKAAKETANATERAAASELAFEKAAKETLNATERAAASELAFESASKRVMELEKTEQTLALRAAAALQKASVAESEATELRATLLARESAFAGQEKRLQGNEKRWSVDIANAKTLVSESVAAAETAKLALEDARTDAREKTLAKVTAERKLAAATARAAEALQTRSTLESRLGVAANVLRRVAAAMGGTPDEAWTPARVESALFDRLATLEQSLLAAKSAASVASKETQDAANDALRSVIAELDETREELAATRMASRDRDAAAADAAAADAKAVAVEQKTNTDALRAELHAARNDAELANANAVSAERRALAEAAGASEANAKVLATREKATQVLKLSNAETSAAKDESRRLAAALARREATLDALELEMKSMPVPSAVEAQKQTRLTRWTVDFFAGFSGAADASAKTSNADAASVPVPLSKRLELLLATKSKELQTLTGSDVTSTDAKEIELALVAVGAAAGEAAALERDLEKARESLKTAETAAFDAREITRQAESKRDAMESDSLSNAEKQKAELSKLREETDVLKQRLAKAEEAAARARAESASRATRAEALLAGRGVANAVAVGITDDALERTEAASKQALSAASTQAVLEKQLAREREAELQLAVDAAQAAVLRSRKEATVAVRARRDAELARDEATRAIISSESAAARARAAGASRTTRAEALLAGRGVADAVAMAAAAEAAVSAERASSAIENEQMELIETLRGEALKFVEVLKKSNEKANAVAAELHKTQASLTQARDSLRQREETSVAELARLTAIVESEKRKREAAETIRDEASEAAGDAPATNASSNPATETNPVLSQARRETELLKAEVSRLQAEMTTKSLAAAKALAEVEAEAKARENANAVTKAGVGSSAGSLFASAKTFLTNAVATTMESGANARRVPSVKALAKRLRVLLNEIDPITAAASATKPTPAKPDELTPNLTKQTVDAAFEVWATLDKVRDELSVLRGVEVAFEESKNLLRSSEETLRKMRETLESKELKLIEAKASYVDAVDESERNEGLLKARIDLLEKEASTANESAKTANQSSAANAVETERLRAELLVSAAKAKRAKEAEKKAQVGLEETVVRLSVEFELKLAQSKKTGAKALTDLDAARTELETVKKLKLVAETDTRTLKETKRKADAESEAARQKGADLEKRLVNAETALAAASETSVADLKKRADETAAAKNVFEKNERKFQNDLAAATDELAIAIAARRKSDNESSALRVSLEAAETRAESAKRNAEEASTEAATTKETLNSDNAKTSLHASVVAQLQGELALARADLKETRVAFDLVQSASEHAVASETALLEKVAALEHELLVAQKQTTKAVPAPPSSDPSSGGKNSYYEIIDGEKYDRGLLDSCRLATRDGGAIALPAARAIVANALDGPNKIQKRGVKSRVTDIELATLRYALGTFVWAPDAETWVYGKVRSDMGGEQGEASKNADEAIKTAEEAIKTLERNLAQSRAALADATRAREVAEAKAEEADAYALMDKEKADDLEIDIEHALAEAAEANEAREVAEREVVSLRSQLDLLKLDETSKTSKSNTVREVITRTANVSVDALRKAFEDRGAELERRVKVVFDAEARSATRWADELAVNNVLVAEKDEEVLLYMKRCEILEAQLVASTSGRVAAELFASRRVVTTQTRETRTLLSTIVTLKAELEEVKVLERQSTAALQIIKSSFSVDSDVAFETADVVSLSSRAAKLARMEAEVSVKEADLLTQDSELKQQQSVLLNKLSSEKAALAVKASRASEKAKAATEKVNVLEKKLAQVQLGNEKVTRELSQALVAAESKLADARKDLDELTRLRKEAREVMTLRATIVSMETALKDSEHAKRAARAVGAALSEKVKTLTADFSDAEQSSKATETALRAETAGLRLEIERITAQLRNAQTRVADLEQETSLNLLASTDAGSALQAANQNAARFENETKLLLDETRKLELRVADRDKAIFARLAELESATAELALVKSELASRKDALLSAEKARDDAVARLEKSDSKKQDAKPATTTASKSERTGTAAWAATNARDVQGELQTTDVDSLRTNALSQTQSEVEERLRAAKESWEVRERDLRRRVRQLEAASTAFDFFGGAGKKKQTDSPLNDLPSKESLTILAKEAEKALRIREVELSTARAAERQARKDARDALRGMETEARKARVAAETATTQFAKLRKEKDAEAAVRDTLENTLRGQIAAYERRRVEVEEHTGKGDVDLTSPTDVDSNSKAPSKVPEASKAASKASKAPSSVSTPPDRVAWMRTSHPAPTETADVASLRTEVERLNAVLVSKSAALDVACAELEKGGEPPADSSPFGKGSQRGSGGGVGGGFSGDKEKEDVDVVLVPKTQVLVVEQAMLAARGEAASLRARLEQKEAELLDRTVREKQLAVAETALRARVRDLSLELQKASVGYDAELARLMTQFSALQLSLAKRESSVEEMQSRHNLDVAAAAAETINRNAEMSDARSELGKMQSALENMAKDVSRAKDVEARLFETSEKLRFAETSLETSAAKVFTLERTTASLTTSLETKHAELAELQTKNDSVKSQLEQASRVVGIAPRDLWVDEKAGAKKTFTTFRVDAGDAAVNATTVGLVLHRLEQRLAQRLVDLETATQKGDASALVTKVSGEVAELKQYKEVVLALRNANQKSSANEAKFEKAAQKLSERQAEIDVLTRKLLDTEFGLSDARLDLQREQGLRQDAASLTEELERSVASVDADREAWEVAKGDLELALEFERTERFLEKERIAEEVFDLENALESARKQVDRLEQKHRTDKDAREVTVSGLRRELEDARDAARDAEARLETAATAAARAAETDAAAFETVEQTLREQLVKATQRRVLERSEFETKNAELMAKSEALETDADAKANAVSEFKQKLEAVESELREAVETASEQRSIAAAKSAALDLALEARDGAFRELASLQTELATSEAKLFVSNATQKKASRDLETATKNVDTTSKGLRKLQRALDDATANAGADAAAAKEAREAALSLREQLVEAEKRRDEASKLAFEERDALGAETKRLETALRDARDTLKRTTLNAEKDVENAIVASEARVERLAAAAADVDARVRAALETPPEQLVLESAAHLRRAESLTKQLADAKASAASLEKHMSARVGEMKAKVETLEHSLAKKRDDREANRLRNELVSLERQRASQVAELETQVADIVAALREARREGQYAEEKRITAEKQAKASGKALESGSVASEQEKNKALEIESSLRDAVAQLELRLAAAEERAAAKTAALVALAGDETRAAAAAAAVKASEILALESRLAETAAASQTRRDETVRELSVSVKARDAAVGTSRGLERRLAETLNALAAASSERDAKAIEVGALQTRLDETTAALVVSNEAATKVSKTASDANTKLVKTLESDMENASQALRVVDLANDALVGEVEQLRAELAETLKRSSADANAANEAVSVSEKKLAESKSARTKLESELTETKEMYAVSLASLVSEKGVLLGKLDAQLAALAENTDSETIKALNEALSLARSEALELKVDLATAREAADAVSVENSEHKRDVTRLTRAMRTMETRFNARQAKRDLEVAADTKKRDEETERVLAETRAERDAAKAKLFVESAEREETQKKEVAELRLRLVELETAYETQLLDMRAVERDLRAALSKAQAASAQGATLEATRTALERRLQDAEATLQAERSRAVAEATTASAKAAKQCAALENQLDALRATRAARDATLRVAWGAAGGRAGGGGGLEKRLVAVERAKTGDAEVAEGGIAKLEAEVSAARDALAEKDEELAVVLSRTETATADASAAETEAEALREKLAAREEMGAVLELKLSDTEEKHTTQGLVVVTLTARLVELTSIAEQRSVAIESLTAEKVLLEFEIAQRVNAHAAKLAAEREAAGLRVLVTSLTQDVTDLTNAIAARDELKAQLLSHDASDVSGQVNFEVSDPAAEPAVPSPWQTLFGDDSREAKVQASKASKPGGLFADANEDAETLEVSAALARLQIVLRQRERALVGLKRLESDGQALAPALGTYRQEIAALTAEARAVRAKLAEKNAAAENLRGRLDVELNILKRETERARSSLTTELVGDVRDALKQRAGILDPLNPAIPLPETLDASRLETLEDKLANAKAKSASAFAQLGSTLGSAAESGKGGALSSENGLSVNLIDVQFSIPFNTRVGQDLFVVGTWCDWDVEKGLALTWTDGDLWQGTMPLHPGYNYEYKYVVLERREGQGPGQPTNGVEWGFAEPSLVRSPSSAANGDSYAQTVGYAAVWQKGNNKALALDNISTKGLAYVEARDDWIADPKNSPIQLVGTDGQVKQIVGSTKLLMECVHRADTYLEEVKTQMEEMYDIAAASIRRRKEKTIDDDDDDDGGDGGLIIA